MCVEHLDNGIRKVRKNHQCYHCYQTIPAGTNAEFFTGKIDYIYTLYFHQDCEACWREYESDARLSICDFDDGYPPLMDDWIDSGDFERLCSAYRGKYPHVICRLELPEQKTDWMDGKELYG